MITVKLLRYQLRDVFRSRWVIFYTIFFMLLTDALFRFGGSGERVILSLINVILIVVPLISIVLGVMFVYQSREFIELMLTQPIRRKSLFKGLYLGLVIPLLGGFIAGVIMPFLWHGGFYDGAGALFLLLTIGSLLTLVFTSLAFNIALKYEDRIKGIGIALITWLFFTVIYDGIILLVIFMFSGYPLQQPVLIMSILNPIDLGRILMLLNFDISALMGFTGAVFQRFFGSTMGQVLSFSALLIWLIIPVLLSMRTFLRKNF